MTKIIKSQSAQLREALAKIRAQEDRIRELERQVNNLQAGKVVTPPTRPSQTARKQKGYMAPTKSSAAKVIKQGTPKGPKVVCHYSDGQDMDFARSTAASRGHETPRHHMYRGDWSRKGKQSPADQASEKRNPREDNTCGDNTCGERIRELDPEDWNNEWAQQQLCREKIERRLQQLAEETGLDREPPSPSVIHVHIDPAAGQRLIRKSYKLALQSLDEYASEHWPDLKRLYFPDGAGCFNLSRPLVMDGIVPWFSSRKIQQLSYSDLEGLVDLRNRVAHPEPCSTRDYDRLIRMAQRFALKLEDAPRARATRLLRDELFRDAEAALARIRLLSGWFALPGDYDDKVWNDHDRRTIRGALRTIEYRSNGSVESPRLPAELEHLYSIS